MTRENGVDRRGFLRRVGAGALGVAAAGSASGAGSATGAGSTSAADEPARKPTDDPRQTAEQDGGIDRFRMLLPAVGPVETAYVNVAVIAGDPIRPGERPPPTCVPEEMDRLRAHDAAIVELTELSWFGGDANDVGEIVRARTYAPRRLPFGRAYRVVGGTHCDGYVRVTVHDLADELAVSVSGSDGE